MGLRGVVAALLCVGLAGCFAGSGSEGFNEGASGVSVGEGRLVLHGVITDERIVPLADVQVVVVGLEGARMNTSEDGQFVFTGVPAGAYYLQLQRKGFLPQQVQLEAVSADGPTASVVLQADFGVPFVAQLVQWTAFLRCSVAGTNPCYLSGSDNVHDFMFAEGRTPNWVQAEAVWTTTSATGEATNSTASLGWHEEGSRDWKRVTGVSPLILVASHYEIVSKEGADADRLTLRLFPEEEVVANQQYEVYTTLFYGFTPRLGWSFSYDGPCDPPESCALGSKIAGR